MSTTVGNREQRPMLTRDDTAAYLAVSKRTLDRLVQAGEIPT
jgi:excisionase family DNA binding protein